MWEQIILDGLKKQDELDLERAAREAPDEKTAEIIRNLPNHIQEVTRNPGQYRDVISLLCFHMLAIKGELFSDYPVEEQSAILENAAYASLGAVSLADKLGDKELKALYLGMAGNALFRIRKFMEAEKVYKRALKIYEDLAKETPRHKLSVVITRDNIGTFYSNTGKFSEAETMYNEALKIMRELEKDVPDLCIHTATTVNNLGNFYKNAGKFFEAEQAYGEALKIRQRLFKKNRKPEMNEPVAMTLNCLGLLYFDTAKFPEAKEKYEEALKIYRRLKRKKQDQKISYMSYIAGCSNNIGNCCSRLNQLSEAESAYRQALKAYEILESQNPALYTPQVATTVNNLGVLHTTKGEYSKAKKSYEKAIGKYKGLGLWFDASRTYYNLYATELKTENLEKSRRLLELGILFSKEKRYKYAQKGEREALYLRLLQNNMGVFGVLEALRDPYLLSLPWETILSEDELKMAQEDLESQKQLAKTILKRKIPKSEPATLPDDVVFIYIQKVGDSTYFLVVDRGGIEKFQCGKEFFQKGKCVYFFLKYQEEEKLRRNATSTTSNKGHKRQQEDNVRGKFDALAREWYETLPGRIKELIQERDYIVFSPDGFCSSLPLEALQQNTEPLCIEKTVVRGTSFHEFSSFLDIKKTRLEFNSSLVVGNPWLRIDQRELSYSLPGGKKSIPILFLEGAEREAATLKTILPKPTLLTNNEATGEEFLSHMRECSLIHFSGHGCLGRILFLCGPYKGFPPPFEPEEFSSLRKKEREEGAKKINMMEDWHPLTDVDLFGVTLKKGAVVFLNSCSTGLHRYERGGYFQGLSAALLKSGAYSVISSLIPLFDEPSKEFAITFYKRLLETHSVSRSLREARIAIRDEYKDQIHWIPYVHYGSPFLEVKPTF
ncbi:MAG: CHAT domain-containing tetratricopeptide repeat protein [Candidatus Methanofastidiosia archaeon]